MADAKTKGPPLVARVVHWAMAKRRRGDTVTAEVLNLLVVVAERYNAKERRARPGNVVLARDTGFATKDTIRRWLREAQMLEAITVTPGQGRGRATEVRFTSDVLNAPGLDEIAELDADAAALIALRRQKGRGATSFSPEKGEHLRPLPLGTPSSTPIPPSEGGRWPRNFVARLVKVWEAQHGKRKAHGDFIAGAFGRLRQNGAPWYGPHGVLAAWRAYVEQEDPKRQSPGAFATKYATWLEPHLSKQEHALQRFLDEAEEMSEHREAHDEF